MADKKHCDICDRVIGGNETTGILIYGSYYDKNKRKNLELCQDHASQMNRAIDELIKGALGFAVDPNKFKVSK